MPEPVLLIEREAPLAILTLNRPDQMNALSSELRIALGTAFHDLEADPEIRAIVLTGAGSPYRSSIFLQRLLARV